jgi:hypothetical protein
VGYSSSPTLHFKSIFKPTTEPADKLREKAAENVDEDEEGSEPA